MARDQTTSFDFDLQQADTAAATPTSQTSPQKAPKRRWSASTDGSRIDFANTRPSGSWEAPPVPPIPPDEPPEAWRRRSLKRDSYTSQMSLRHSESGTNLVGMATTPASGTTDDISVLTDGEPTTKPAMGSHMPRGGRKRSSRVAMDMREKSQYDELHWQVSGLNPNGWSRRKKWLHTLAAGGVACAVLFSSSIVAPARSAIENSFSTSPVVAVLSTALYVLGLTFGSVLGGASAALVGRRIGQSAALLVSAAFTIASACVNSFAALHASRFLAGLFASPAMWISLAVLLDIWTAETMAVPAIVFTGMALAGLALGPVAGSYIIESQNVRWCQYAVIIACAVAMALVIGMRETHKDTVQRASRPTLRRVFEASAIAPLAALFRTPTVLIFSIYAGTILGTLYTAFTAFLSALASTYDLSLTGQGLTVFAILLGVLLATAVLGLNHQLLYRPRVRTCRQQYDAEVERALVEEEIQRRSRRNSRASTNKLQKRRSTASQLPSSATQAVHRTSFKQTFAKRDSRSDLVSTTIDFEDKNVALSVAVAENLNSVNEKRILPERVLLILSKHLSFGETCDQLESYGLLVDRVKLAQVFLDALQRPLPTPETRPATAATTLENVQPATRPGLDNLQSTVTLLSHASTTFTAPPVWRLWPLLPASVVMTGSLFLFAWTARNGIHWMAPVVGMGLFALSGAIALVSLVLYTLEKHGQDAIACGSGVVWMVAAVFPIFSVPMFTTLGTAWAGSVLGFIALVCAIPVWVVVIKAGKR